MTKLLTGLQRRIANGLSIEQYCAFVNRGNAMIGRAHRLHPMREDGLHRVTHGKEEIVICRRERHRCYKRGVTACVDRLAREYGVAEITDTQGGVFIDCGANVGELGFWATRSGMTYHAFEPEALEADCVDLNLFGGQTKTRRQALWNKAETLTFYTAPDNADSSLFQARQAKGSVQVQAIPLDDAGIDLSGTGPNILKLEAEGAEPEILDGAIKTLPKLHYVAVDCGYERGLEKRHTFIDVCDRLLPMGFIPVEADLRRVTVLFKNSDLG